MPVGRPKSKEESRPVLVRFPAEKYRELEKAAKADSRKIAPFVRLLVERQLEQMREADL